MSIVTVLVTLAIVGFLLWLVINFVPMEPTIRKIMVAAVALITVLWLLNVTGILGNLGNIRVGQ